MQRGSGANKLAVIAVVIPYYQEQPGILRRAVASACAQVGVSKLDVIVVDDGSPVPAREDLRDLAIPPHVSLRILEQENAGPGAARNRALDNLAEGTRYVAFLDSDDKWVETHLQNAVQALGRGFDFYFANAWHSEYGTTFFQKQGLDLQEHQAIPDTSYRALTNFARIDLISGKNYFHMSTVVYNYHRLPTLRFPESFPIGEDITFWMHILTITKNAIFFADVECKSGQGFHLYEFSGWGTSRALYRTLSYIKWRTWVLSNFSLTGDEVTSNKKQLMKLEREFVHSALHDISRLRVGSLPLVYRRFAEQPSTIPPFLRITLETILGKLWRSA